MKSLKSESNEMLETDDKKLLRIAVETIRRYTTTLGTILVESGGELIFNPTYTTDLAGKHVDFEVALMEDGMIKVKLIVDGKYWKEAEETTEEQQEE